MSVYEKAPETVRAIIGRVRADRASREQEA
jgi:hypothetical protein